MSDFISECEKTISTVQNLLNDKDNKQDWVSRYEEYAGKIDSNLETIRINKRRFREWAPLYLYMNVSEAKGRLTFGLRYLGQDVAKLKVGKDKITLSTNGYENSNSDYFGCKIRLADCEWRSDDVAKFRSQFINPPKNENGTAKLNDEHRIESLLLTEFSKKKGDNKILCNIQPVKIAGIARFQMPTPLSASNMEKLIYSGRSGGGIDMLTRVGTGGSVKLCILELKDTNNAREPAAKAIQQGLAYATFIRELLRSKSGEAWWKLFGFTRKHPVKLKLYVACVMPSLANNDTTFADQVVKVDDDSIYFHYIYFKEFENIITFVETSIKECKAKNSLDLSASS